MKNSEIILAGDGPLPDSKLMSRLLAKIALEAMAFRLLEADLSIEALIADSQLDPIRSWARYGSSVTQWGFCRRVIYDANHKHRAASGETFQVLNEFDFLGTEKSELYFCLAVFGVEYTINIGGPSFEGYLEWLETNPGCSPLYPEGRTKDAVFPRQLEESIEAPSDRIIN